jgi:hypothetical protein
MSKGSKPRPIEIPRDNFEKNWDAIFKKVKNESSGSNSNNRVKDTKEVHRLG